MPILITGGAGYIGSHTVKELLVLGYDVLILDNLHKGHQEAVDRCIDTAQSTQEKVQSAQANTAQLAHGTTHSVQTSTTQSTGAGRCSFVHGDLADRQLLAGLFAEHRIKAVVHFAADSLVGESMTMPAKYFQNNVVNGLNLLNAMREAGVSKLVFSSTAAVYGEPEEWPITEEFQKNPTNTYGLTKLQFEEIMHTYEQAYGLKYIALRYFNAAGADITGEIGEDHHPESHLIPLVLQTALGQREQITIYGTDYPTPDGTCIRDYIHVSDLAQAHILALQKLLQSENCASSIYNLGNGNGYSVREVIETARRVTGRQIKVEEGERRSGDPAVLVASSEKLKQELGWQPRWPGLDEIISSAWKWHSRYPDGYKAKQAE